jgi:vacuolar-type H+-ATPase subunit H
MDILHLIDRLEELFNESRAIPLTHNVVVDEDRMLEIIDQMRIVIPDEVKKAQQFLAQRDRIIAQAQEESGRIIQLARDKADELIERDQIAQAARQRAEQIIAQARAEAQATRRDADDYVMDVLLHLENDLDRIMLQVRNGLQTLREAREREEAANPPPAPPAQAAQPEPSEENQQQ